MTIKAGDKFPQATVKKQGSGGLEDIDVTKSLAGRRVVIIGVPGAFTPSCHQKHLPGYIEKHDQIKAEGIDEIICMAVNDAFVMKAWGEKLGAEGKVTLWADGNAELTRKLGLDFDGSGPGLGTRCKRFSMVVQDGVVESLEVEDKPSDVSVSGVEACLVRL